MTAATPTTNLATSKTRSVSLIEATLLLLSIIIASITSTESLTDQKSCGSKACRDAATDIRVSLNTTLNPCDNFYRFACDGWRAKNAIPRWTHRISVIDMIKLRNLQRMRRLLEASPQKSSPHKNLFRSKATRFAAYIYANCVRFTSATNRGDQIDPNSSLAKFRELLRYMWREDDDVVGDDHRNDERRFRWTSMFVDVIAGVGLAPIFEISTRADTDNATNRLLEFKPAMLGLGDKDFANISANFALVDAYRRLMLEMSTAILGGGQYFAPEQLAEDVREIIQLEQELARAKLQFKTYAKMRLRHFIEETGIDWIGAILRPLSKRMSIFGSGSRSFESMINLETPIFVSNLEYYRVASQIIRHTPERVLRNYFTWMVMLNFGTNFAPEPLRRSIHRFQAVKFGTAEPKERWHACFSAISGDLDWALSRLFIADSVSRDQDRNLANVSRLIDSIRSSVIELINENTWLDADAKRDSIGKIRRTIANIGYPQWLFDDRALDRYYSFDSKNSDFDFDFVDRVRKNANRKDYNYNYIIQYAKFLAAQKRKSITKLSEPIMRKNSWIFAPFTVNAGYYWTRNTLTLGAGAIQQPLFSSDYPAALNMARIGALIAHEYMHALDNIGRQFNWRGNLRNWWPAAAIHRFQNRTECFVKQYGRQRDPNTKLMIDGRLTLSENIADNGGLRAAFHAYRRLVSSSSSSVAKDFLPQFNADQLFFVAFATAGCDRHRSKSARDHIRSQPYAPNEFRVNIPLRNMPEFARAFRCPARSAMRLDDGDRCRLW